MILETWTESERVALKQIEVQLLHMFREEQSSNALYEYLTKCLLSTSSRVVIFASLLAGAIYKSQKIEREVKARMLLDERFEKMLEAVEMNFSQSNTQTICKH